MVADPSKVALITGCSSGIGRATAGMLNRHGFTVYATARQVDRLLDLGASGCRTLALDVTDEASMAAAVGQVKAEAGAVGILINNAGYGLEGPLEELSMDELRRQFETNVFGLTRMCQLVLPGMRKLGRGRIINVSSMGGRFTLPGGGAYHASKYAVEALSDALRFEVRPFGVRVVLVEPGPVKTEWGAIAASHARSTPGAEGPYAGFRRTLAKTLEDAYEGPMSRLAAPPEAVARVIERAIRSRSPRPRYVVTGVARMLIGTKAILPDRAWDLAMRVQFRVPPE